MSSDPPLLAGGDQLSVTLLLVTFVTCTCCGLDGGATNNIERRSVTKRKVQTMKIMKLTFTHDYLR